ncbi:MAG: diguanylate cyclase [Frankiales bacterium]|nr:diguanylate cyclase [Frankiales bacterium]
MIENELRLPSPRIAWATFAVTVLATVAYLFVGDGARSLILLVVALIGIVGVSAGATWLNPRVRWPWYAISGAGVFFLAGAILRSALVNPNGELTSLVPDSFTLPGYVIFGFALVGLLRSRRANEDTATLTDAVVVGAAATLVAVAFLVEPTLAQHSGTALLHIVSAVYPPIDILLLLVLLQLAFTDVSGAPAFWFLTLSLAAILVGDTGYAVQLAGVAHPYARLLDTPYLVAYGGLATAALHPSMWLLTNAQPLAVRPMSRWRLMTVALAVISPAVVMLSRPPVHTRDQIIYALAITVLMSAVFSRSVRAVNEHATSEAHLSLLATRDALTGLANRTRVGQFLADEMPRAVVADRRVGLILLDLDRFQVINDHWGHGVGDELLVAVADRLLSLLPDMLVARTGGDEFIVAGRLPVDDPLAEQLTGRVMSAFEQVFEVSAGQLVVTTSAGVSTLRPDRDSSNQTLLRDADTAMYRAKTGGGDRCVRFVEEMHAEIAEHVAIEQRLRRAVAADGFELHYQPIVNLVDGTVRGYEALLRMRPDGFSPLRPDEFIPVAESTGLILPIGAFVLDEACRQIALWRSDPRLDMDDVFVAVNVSSRQLHEHGFVAEVLGALERNGVPERCLHIEITESLLMDDIEMAIEMLDVLRDRGINISVDDFGTGHSSLGYLKRLPVGTVKVDRSFVSALGDLDSAGSRDDEAIVRAVMGMAKALNLSVVAEGVETTAQRDVLRAMGCTYAQGWLYGRPMLPDDAAAAWNRTHRSPAIAS